MRRTLLVSLVPSLLALSTSAGAAPASPLQPLPATLPARCAPLAKVPAARIAGPDLAAHVSVAACLAESAMGRVALTADAAGVAALDAAVAPSVAILDDVIAHGDARWRLVAERRLGDLDLAMITRVRAAAGADAGARAAVEPLLGAWRIGATAAFLEVDRIAEAHPELLTHDAVVAAAAAVAHAPRAAAQ